ncbi:hypothetical protein BC834DRAFT_844491 [Gloeopeniophorella convolvens]|nr:hypothetical protein BC834DRAFT_844491 [Gloeopeniophorella convolvens]
MSPVDEPRSPASNPRASSTPTTSDRPGAAPTFNMSHTNNSSDGGYPSWLPQRPPPPAPGSTLHSFSTNILLAADAGPSTEPEPPAAAPVLPFAGGRKPTPRSVRVVSVQDAAAAARRDRDATDQTRVSSLAAPPLLSSRVWSRATGRSPTLLSQALRARAAAPPRFRAQGLHLELLRDPSWKTRLHFYLFPLLVFAHVPLQTFLDFNAVFMIIEVSKFPNPVAPGVPGSGRNWVLGAVAYIACWAIWIFGVFIGYELIYSFVRRWRFRRPLILPIYLSAPAYNLAAMSSYSHFCFLQHIRNSAFPRAGAGAVLPSAEGSLRDALAETCYFYAQNLPTVTTLLPRAGLALALLLAFWSPAHLPGGLALPQVDPALARRDGTFFDGRTGALKGYAKGVLVANAAWAAWRALVLLYSWLGLWIFSGHGCAGLCGPRSRQDEEEAGRAASVSVSALSEKHAADDAPLPWEWRECTLLRVQEAYDFCLTLRPPRAQPPAAEGAGGFDGIEKVFAAVGLGGGAAHVPPARRGMLSRELFESPREGPTRRGSAAEANGNGNGNGNGVQPEGNGRAPYPFTGFGARESGEQEQIPFPPSPGLPDEGSQHEEEEEEEEEEEALEEAEEEEEEEEERQPRTSEDPSSFSGRASNSLSSLGQPLPPRYPFTFRRAPSSSAGSPPPPAFARHTPQSKSTSTRASRTSRSTGNAESTTTTDESAGSPVSPAGSASPSPGMPMPMPPRHPAARRARAGTVPVPGPGPVPASPASPSPPARRPRAARMSFRESMSSAAGATLPESDRESERQPSPDGSLEAREREDSLGLLSAHPSPRGSAVSLARLSGAWRSRSRHTSSSSGSPNSHSGSGNNSRASSRAPRPVRLAGHSESEGDGALSNPENHTFGRPVAGTGMRRDAGARARTLESAASSAESVRERDEARGSLRARSQSASASERGAVAAVVRAFAEADAHVDVDVDAEADTQRVGTAPVPIPGIRVQAEAEAPGGRDVSTAAGSLVSAPATVEGATTASSAPSEPGLVHYVPPGARDLVPH